MNFLIVIFLTWVLNAVALSLVAAVVPGIRINSVGAAVNDLTTSLSATALKRT